MAIPIFLKPFLTKEAFFGYALAFHQKIWRLVELGGDVDFITTYSGAAWKFLTDDWGTWLIVTLGAGLVIHSYIRHREPRVTDVSQPAALVEKPIYVSPYAGKEQELVPEKPEERQWPKTSDYDLPIKLGVIDNLLGIIGAEKECEQLAREGKRFSQNWEREIKQNGAKHFLDALKDYGIRCVGLQSKINKIRQENEKYEDIEYILRPEGRNNIFRPLNLFTQAIGKLDETPLGELGFFILPFANEFEEGRKGFGRWRFETENALLARRKELSG